MTPPDQHASTPDLFDGATGDIALAEGAIVLTGFALSVATQLIDAIEHVTESAPFRHLITPGGRRMSVAMTNCGEVGWISDRRGYRYEPTAPESGKPWPAMPSVFADLSSQAAAAAGFPGFRPDACLINRYVPGARLTLHQDLNEQNFNEPIVSVSLGLTATFLFGGLSRSERTRRVRLTHGDVVVFGGPARMRFHGIMPLGDGEHALTGRQRINLTFRRAS
jgi:alkylated DNA repair protein (DNA oxidative demethylase)